ncbi:MAG TPA: hypothetical protein VLA12_00850, partial [Planctomycetaceae bacterium]|nr:hypothetical protein [Planctomycetaceae bacterium]
MRVVAFCLIALLHVQVVLAQVEDLARELERLPAVEANDAAATLTVERGFQMVQVAAEPLVSDPIDACFDAAG